MRGRQRHGNCRLKSEFADSQSSSWLFQLAYLVNHVRNLLELNSEEPHPSSERERKFRCCLFTFSIRHGIRQFHVVVLQKRQRNVQKNVLHKQSCYFAY